MFGFIVPVLVGVLCIASGISNMRGNISSLHSYHRSRVAEEDVLPFGRLVGLGTVIIGISAIALGGFLLAAALHGSDAYVLLGVVILMLGLAVGLGLSFGAMIKYNKGIF